MRVYEIFRSIDGEVNACHQGRISTFVRFAGCNLKCSYCFAPLANEIKLKVVMADKRYKPLSEVKVGDRLTTLHPWSRRPVETRVKGVSVRTTHSVEMVSAGVYKFLATPGHKMFTQKGLLKVSELSRSDKLVYVAYEVWRERRDVQDLTFLPVDHKPYDRSSLPVKVYNIQCEPYPTYLLNGLWVHNCDIEEAQRADKAVEMTVDEIMEQIRKLGCRKVTLTGGEPLLQKDFFDLTRSLAVEKFDVTVETNGTLPLVGYGVRSWVVDFKLPSSGEYEKVNRQIFKTLRPCDFVKFVISDKLDFEYAVMEARKLKEQGCRAQIAFSPVFEVLQPKELYSWICEEGFLDVILNVQIHKIVGLS